MESTVATASAPDWTLDKLPVVHIKASLAIRGCRESGASAHTCVLEHPCSSSQQLVQVTPALLGPLQAGEQGLALPTAGLQTGGACSMLLRQTIEGLVAGLLVQALQAVPATSLGSLKGCMAADSSVLCCSVYTL